MTYKTSFYHRQRSKHQQPPTDAPCLSCGAKPAENCHLIDWLRLRRLGFPPSVINQDWNLVPLCRPCHWLYDDREDIWVNHHLKEDSLSSKAHEVLESFRILLQKHSILAAPVTEHKAGEAFPSISPHFGDVYDVEFAWGDNCTLLKTKIGDLLVVDHLTEVDCNKAELLWKECLSGFKVLSTKEFRGKREALQQEFMQNRSSLLALLNPKMERALEKAKEMAETHRKFIDLQAGNPWSETLEISGFDVTKVGTGVIRVYLWEKGF